MKKLRLVRQLRRASQRLADRLIIGSAVDIISLAHDRVPEPECSKGELYRNAPALISGESVGTRHVSIVDVLVQNTLEHVLFYEVAVDERHHKARAVEFPVGELPRW